MKPSTTVLVGTNVEDEERHRALLSSLLFYLPLVRSIPKH